MRFERFGITFDYPDGWEVDTGDGDHAAVTVYTPEGGFWSVSGHAAGGRAAELAAAVEREMRDEYRDLDAEPAADDVGGRRLDGIDMNFSFLDLTNTAQVRTLTLGERIWLLFCQAEDREWERVAPVFAAITASFVGGLVD
jgi:hypothetical protein